MPAAGLGTQEQEVNLNLSPRKRNVSSQGGKQSSKALWRMCSRCEAAFLIMTTTDLQHRSPTTCAFFDETICWHHLMSKKSATASAYRLLLSPRKLANTPSKKSHNFAAYELTTFTHETSFISSISGSWCNVLGRLFALVKNGIEIHVPI
jgi:hypothetical protein